MERLQFVKDYKNDERLRTSFIQLANEIFGLNFETWYAKGFWSDRYIPFSYAIEGRVVANVSVNKLDLLIGGEKVAALQIGTVMTHPDYRNRGLSAKLMETVLEAFDGQCEVMYLFANESVLDFYPKFGFVPVEEQQVSAAYSLREKGKNLARKLDLSKDADLQKVQELVASRAPVSTVFSTEEASGITMYHCLEVFPDHLYLLEELEVLVIYEKNGSQLDLFDIISKKPVSVLSVLPYISDEEVEQVVFYFTPDTQGLKVETAPFKRNGALFVKAASDKKYPAGVLHPITSEA